MHNQCMPCASLRRPYLIPPPKARTYLQLPLALLQPLDLMPRLAQLLPQRGHYRYLRRLCLQLSHPLLQERHLHGQGQRQNATVGRTQSILTQPLAFTHTAQFRLAPLIRLGMAT